MWEFGGVEYAGKGEMVNENNDIKISWNPICGSYSFYNFQQFKSYIQTINDLYWIPKHPHIQATSILHLLALTI
jgi:hypothetical protein